ncbi:MAG TPA: hypothetical protein VHY82_04595 [Acetobacteraceae bacterium]|jgi:hypothetical protein|nr:hypothetical protein [Acetobacteraceae bacterium]
MSGRQRGPLPSPGSIVIGIVRIARGRADGMAQFGATRDAFLTSLAPLIAFPLVGGVLMALGGGGLAALSDLMATLCALIAPLVLSFEVARLWRRQEFWLRFATAFNWCQWVIPVVGILLLAAFGSLAAVGLPPSVAQIGIVLALVSYALWLHWFLARHGLGLSRWRALLMVFAVNFATLLLVVGPRVVTLGMSDT